MCVYGTLFLVTKIVAYISGAQKCDVPPICFALIRVENLDFYKRARVAEILGVLGNGVAIQAGVAGVLHQIPEFFLPPLFP